MTGRCRDRTSSTRREPAAMPGHPTLRLRVAEYGMVSFGVGSYRSLWHRPSKGACADIERAMRDG